MAWRTSNRYDRLTDAAKAAAGYPTAEHDVPSVREPREDNADSYWLVIVDRGTGRATTTEITDADAAHRQAGRCNSNSTYATVVGKR